MLIELTQLFLGPLFEGAVSEADRGRDRILVGWFPASWVFAENIDKIYVNYDNFSGEYGEEKLESYKPVHECGEKSERFGHGGSDFYSMYHFVEKIKGNPDADIIDVYEALDMFLPGMFAYRSILDGSMPKKIPNLRNKEERDAWRNDTACTDPKVAGDMLLPTCPGGTPEIDDAVYDRMKELWEIEKNKKEGNYRAAAMKQGSKTK